MRIRASVAVAVLVCATLAGCLRNQPRPLEEERVGGVIPRAEKPSTDPFLGSVITIAGRAPPPQAQRSLRLVVPHLWITPVPRGAPFGVVPFHLYRAPAIGPRIAVRPFIPHDAIPRWKARPRMAPVPRTGEMQI